MKSWITIIVVALVLVGLGYTTNLISKTDKGPTREDVTSDLEKTIKQIDHSSSPAIGKRATEAPGRVVELETSRGIIDFVLFEKDCPKTTARVAGLVQKGAYNGVAFPRVENWVIQIDKAKAEVKPMGLELCSGWTQAKGTVGMARTNDPNSNTSIFYILLDPAPHLDSGYTNFGRLIKGMDVAMKIKKGDVIKRAVLRDLTEQDKKLFIEILKIESERRTQ